MKDLTIHLKSVNNHEHYEIVPYFLGVSHLQMLESLPQVLRIDPSAFVIARRIVNVKT